MAQHRSINKFTGPGAYNAEPPSSPRSCCLVPFFPSVAQAQPSTSLEKLWNELADVDAAKAYRAILGLTKKPKETVAFIADKMAPAVAADPRKVEELVGGLNSENFGVRDKAEKELTELGDLVEPALRQALQAKPALETSKRIEKLLDRLVGPIALPAQLSAVRAVRNFGVYRH